MSFRSIARLISPYEGTLQYLRSFSWLTIEQLVRLPASLVVGVWVARYLGPVHYGLLAYAQSFVGIFAAIAVSGLDEIIVRELVKTDSARKSILGTALVLKVAGASIATLAVIIAERLLDDNSVSRTLVFIISASLLFQSAGVLDLYFQSSVNSKYSVAARVFGLLVSSSIKIALILLNAPVMAIAIAIVAESAMAALAYFYYGVRADVRIRELRFDVAFARKILRDGWPLIIASAFLMIQARIDQVILKYLSTAQEVAYYSVALRLIEFFGFIPIAVKISIFPAIAGAKKTSRDAYEKRLLIYYRLSFLLFVVAAVPIFLYAAPFVAALYGRAYAPAGVLLGVMAIRLLFTNMGVARGVFLLIENMTFYSLVTMMIGTCVNVIGNVLLIPQYGAMGSVCATIVSFFVTEFVVDLLNPATRKNVVLMLYGILSFPALFPFWGKRHAA